MSDLVGNHIVGFPTRWLLLFVVNDTIDCPVTTSSEELFPLLKKCTTIHWFLMMQLNHNNF